MRYKIIFNGEDYRVLLKDFLGWDYMPQVFSDGTISDVFCQEFKTEEAAEKEVRIRYGTMAKRIREWRIV